MSEEAPDYLCDLLFMDSSYLPMLTLEVQLKGTFIMFMFLLLIVAITKKSTQCVWSEYMEYNYLMKSKLHKIYHNLNIFLKCMPTVFYTRLICIQ